MPVSRVVLDTDTYNEVDDQFALAYLLLSPEAVSLEAVYAAPFSNARASGPAEGMELSYDEIHRVMDAVNLPVRPPVFRGSTEYLPGPATPVQSEMIADLVERAMHMPPGEKLQVLAIAAITNVASALLVEPRIAPRIRIVWLGGHAPYWHHTREFNLKQDLHAARIVFDSEADLVWIPCEPVTDHLLVTVAELDALLAPFSGIGKYLTDIVHRYNGANLPAWSKPIWDISASAYAVNPQWLESHVGPSPVLLDDCTWGPQPIPARRNVEIVRKVNRDAIFADFFAKTKKLGAG